MCAQVFILHENQMDENELLKNNDAKISSDSHVLQYMLSVLKVKF